MLRFRKKWVGMNLVAGLGARSATVACPFGSDTTNA